MKTQQQRIFEAQVRREVARRHHREPEQASPPAAQPDAQPDVHHAQRERNESARGVQARVDSDGNPLPKGAYRSAAEHGYVYREYWRPRHSNGILAHRGAPVSGNPGLWRLACTRADCGGEFVTSARQSRFCSEACARADQRAKAQAKRTRLESVTVECAKAGCLERIFQLRPDHRYCSASCRNDARTRARVVHEARPCDACGAQFTPKNARARFCGPNCRVRAWKRAQVDPNADTAPLDGL